MPQDVSTPNAEKRNQPRTNGGAQIGKVNAFKLIDREKEIEDHRIEPGYVLTVDLLKPAGKVACRQIEKERCGGVQADLKISHTVLLLPVLRHFFVLPRVCGAIKLSFSIGRAANFVKS